MRYKNKRTRQGGKLIVERIEIYDEGEIDRDELEKIAEEIIKILADKNITHFETKLILEEVKRQLEHTIVKLSY